MLQTSSSEESRRVSLPVLKYLGRHNTLTFCLMSFFHRSQPLKSTVSADHKPDPFLWGMVENELWIKEVDEEGLVAPQRLEGWRHTWGHLLYYVSKKSSYWSPVFEDSSTVAYGWEVLWYSPSEGIYWFNFFWKGVGGCVGCMCEDIWSQAALRTYSAYNKWRDFLQKLINAPIQTANVDSVRQLIWFWTLNTFLLLPVSLDCHFFP